MSDEGYTPPRPIRRPVQAGRPVEVIPTRREERERAEEEIRGFMRGGAVTDAMTRIGVPHVGE